jgi:hypothetical protein
LLIDSGLHSDISGDHASHRLSVDNYLDMWTYLAVYLLNVFFPGILQHDLCILHHVRWVY